MYMPVDDEIIAQVVANVRMADRLEFECLRGLSVEEEIRHSVGLSAAPQAVMAEGKVLALFGDIKHDDQIGVPWMISTTALERHQRVFLKACDEQIALMRTRHKVLINYTDARYTKALRWMRWCGFQMHDAIPYGAHGELFHPFTLRGL